MSDRSRFIAVAMGFISGFISALFIIIFPKRGLRRLLRDKQQSR